MASAETPTHVYPPVNTYRRILRRFGLLCLVVLALSSCTGLQIWKYPSDPGNSAGAAVILGAAVWNGQPSPVYRERLRHAVQLYQEKRVQLLIFTGGTAKGETYSEAEVGQRFALEQGVAAEHIRMEELSTRTREQLAFTRELLTQEKISRVLIVSDPLHLRRAMIMAKDLGLSAEASPTPTTRYRTWNSQWPFLRREIFYTLQYQLITRFLPLREQQLEEINQAIE